MMNLRSDDPVAVALARAIRAGDVDSLDQLLDQHPGLASARIEADNGKSRTSLHIATDWPGYFPNGPAVAHLLLDAGADPDARTTGAGYPETPLHWTASSDDVDIATELIDGGADIEAPGASIGGGTALDNAVGYGCWHVARLLVDRGARVDKLWHAAALGLLARVSELLAASPTPTLDEITEAFWHACAAGQRRAAEHLLALGADINQIPDYSKRTAIDEAGALDTRRQTLVTWLRLHGAKSADELSSPGEQDGGSADR